MGTSGGGGGGAKGSQQKGGMKKKKSKKGSAGGAGGGGNKENAPPIKQQGGTGGGVKPLQDPRWKSRTYFKVFASFQCSGCSRGWHSAHGWEREDDEGGINCEACGKAAELKNAVDEVILIN